jgi:hypothetical protein
VVVLVLEQIFSIVVELAVAEMAVQPLIMLAI